MIAYVDTPPVIEMHGEHFLITLESGSEQKQFMLTMKAFGILKVRCAEADALRQLAELDAREKVVPFPEKGPTQEDLRLIRPMALF